MKKIKSEKDGYFQNSEFWTKKGDTCTVIGDYLGRIPALELLDAKPGERVLDAGCGAGFIARRIAKTKGISACGCDRDERMLNQAIRTEVESPLGIAYAKADITNLPYENLFFNAVICVAVLMHNSKKNAKGSLQKLGECLLRAAD